jgi:hypothetical protein
MSHVVGFKKKRIGFGSWKPCCWHTSYHPSISNPIIKGTSNLTTEMERRPILEEYGCSIFLDFNVFHCGKCNNSDTKRQSIPLIMFPAIKKVPFRRPFRISHHNLTSGVPCLHSETYCDYSAPMIQQLRQLTDINVEVKSVNNKRLSESSSF